MLDAQHAYLRSVVVAHETADDDRFPLNLPCVQALREPLQLHPNVTFLVGENGSGKSTVLEGLAVALGFNPEGGSKNFHFATRDSHSDLHDMLRITRGFTRARDTFFLRAESFYNVATEIDALGATSSYGGESLHAMSHGEGFLQLFLERFRGDGVYLLDEPEAALSPSRQLSLLTRLHDLVKANSQFVIATHSPILLAYPHATIYTLDEDGIAINDYEDTEPYRVTRDFLRAPKRMLALLMDE